ncbi:MAG: hypothetical protein O7D34_11915 [Ignavibacteria bacterium]|nr:hypothetical protein [Ignavibacteria bacterium]
MKTTLLMLMIGLLASGASANDIIVRKVQGEVSVRRGVEEVWTEVAVGDVLRPNDSMRTGRKSGAVLVAPVLDSEASVMKTITLPSKVIIDMSDLRMLSQEELMLKLTMEKVRASSYEWKKNEMNIPNTTVVHGADRSSQSSLNEGELEVGVFQLNGTRVLYDNGFYSTCALKAIQVLRRFPQLSDRFEHRLMVAEALEKSSLRSEAINEYVALSSLESISPEQKDIVLARIARLKNQTAQ